MYYTRVSFEKDIPANSATTLLFRKFVNDASPQEILELWRNTPDISEITTALLMMYYAENIYELDGETFSVKDEKFIEELARLALKTEGVEELAFTILAFAPKVPAWAGDALDWLKDQEFERMHFIASELLVLGLRPMSRVGGGQMAALRTRYAEHDAINTIANLIFEKTELPIFEELMRFDERQAQRYIIRLELVGLLTHTSAEDWIADLQADFGSLPYPIVDQVITRYTAIIIDMKSAVTT